VTESAADAGRPAWPATRGPNREVLTDDVLGQAFGLPIAVEHRDERTWARPRR
jgi:hypothetical protein